MKKMKAQPKSKKSSTKELVVSGGLPDLRRVESADEEDQEEQNEPKDYEVEDAVRTLGNAEEIKKNKKLMPHVHKKISNKITSLKDLKKLASKKAVDEGENES